MNADKRNRKLDELISGAVSRDRPQFDFDKWKQEHRKQIDIFQSQEDSASAGFENAPTTPLQCHLDMVNENLKNSAHLRILGSRNA